MCHCRRHRHRSRRRARPIMIEVRSSDLVTFHVMPVPIFFSFHIFRNRKGLTLLKHTQRDTHTQTLCIAQISF